MPDIAQHDADLGNKGFCMRLAEGMFRQPAIGENRTGLLRRAFDEAGYSGWTCAGHWQGYITLFTMRKAPRAAT